MLGPWSALASTTLSFSTSMPYELGVGNGALEHFFNKAGRFLRGVAKSHHGISDFLAANQRQHLTNFERRNTNRLGNCISLHVNVPLYLPALGAVGTERSWPAWPVKRLVRENSPSLCPIMFSLT